MTFLQKIEVAIYELEMKNVPRNKIQIACSPIIMRLLEQEFVVAYYKISYTPFSRFLGADIYEFHPHNEIVVYHKDVGCRFDDLKIVIPFTRKNKPMCQKQTNQPLTMFDVLYGQYAFSEEQLKALLKKVYYQGFSNALADDFHSAEEFINSFFEKKP